MIEKILVASCPVEWLTLLKDSSLVDSSKFGNFGHCIEMFPTTACESYCKSYEQYFDSLLLKAELSDVYSLEEI
jgi:hypothetical protein